AGPLVVDVVLVGRPVAARPGDVRRLALHGQRLEPVLQGRGEDGGGVLPGPGFFLAGLAAELVAGTGGRGAVDTAGSGQECENKSIFGHGCHLSYIDTA